MMGSFGPPISGCHDYSSCPLRPRGLHYRDEQVVLIDCCELHDPDSDPDSAQGNLRFHLGIHPESLENMGKRHGGFKAFTQRLTAAIEGALMAQGGDILVAAFCL